MSNKYTTLCRDRGCDARSAARILSLKSTKFSEIKISASRWLILIKLFELSVSDRKASVEMNMSYKTTLKAFDLLRKAIAEELSKYEES